MQLVKSLVLSLYSYMGSCIVIMNILSVESHKGVNDVQRCSIENQKGAMAVQSLWQLSPCGSRQIIVEQR